MCSQSLCVVVFGPTLYSEHTFELLPDRCKKFHVQPLGGSVELQNGYHGMEKQGCVSRLTGQLKVNVAWSYIAGLKAVHMVTGFDLGRKTTLLEFFKATFEATLSWDKDGPQLTNVTTACLAVFL